MKIINIILTILATLFGFINLKNTRNNLKFTNEDKQNLNSNQMLDFLLVNDFNKKLSDNEDEKTTEENTFDKLITSEINFEDIPKKNNEKAIHNSRDIINVSLLKPFIFGIENDSTNVRTTTNTSDLVGNNFLIEDDETKEMINENSLNKILSEKHNDQTIIIKPHLFNCIDERLKDFTDLSYIQSICSKIINFSKNSVS